MSAQKSKPRGALGALAGMLGLSALAGLLVTAMVTPAIAVTGMTANSTIGIFDSLPSYIRLDAQSQRNSIYGIDGEGNPALIANVFHQNREEVGWDEVSQFVKDGLVATEDRRFYEHGGVDLAGVTRAALTNIVAGGIAEGASTLSMQLVKNILMMDATNKETEAERKAALDAAQAQTFDRKLKEMKLAIGLEKSYTKDEILLGYLNIAGFGGNTYGIESAAQQFFSVNAKDVTLAQAASLVAIVQTPTYHSLNNPDNYERNEIRRNTVLDLMLQEGYITPEQHAEARATPLEPVLSPPQNGCYYATTGNFFCDYVTRLVPELESLGATPEERTDNWKRGGYEIYTTLDMSQQQHADGVLAAEAPPEESRFWLGAAASAVEAGTGRILAMSQNKTFDNTQDGGGPTTTAVNYNTDKPYGGSSGFQSGSTYKIFTLVEWLKENHGLHEAVDGRVKTYNLADFRAPCLGGQTGTWKANNYGGAGGSASTSVLRATSASINSAYAAMAFKLDLCGIRDTALAMGVHRADGGELQANPAAILGTNEIAPLGMAAAMATIAAGGIYCEPIAVDRIVNAKGEELPGQTQQCEQVIAPEIAAGAAYALRQVMTGGTGGAANPGGSVPVIGKTGTTDNAEHTWMVGASTSVGLAAWVGNIEGHANLQRYGLPKGNANSARYRIFRSIMASLNASYGGTAWPQPEGSILNGQTATVPDVMGQTPAQAVSLLESLGFTAADGGPIDSQLEAGRVASMNPGAGAKIPRGSVITFYTSNGSLDRVMPPVVGLMRTAAAAAVAQAGITGTVAFNYVKTEDPELICQVAGSTPAAGTAMSAASNVVLDVYSETAGMEPNPAECS